MSFCLLLCTTKNKMRPGRRRGKHASRGFMQSGSGSPTKARRNSRTTRPLVDRAKTPNGLWSLTEVVGWRREWTTECSQRCQSSNFEDPTDIPVYLYSLGEFGRIPKTTAKQVRFVTVSWKTIGLFFRL